jgi:hypothetical protein
MLLGVWEQNPFSKLARDTSRGPVNEVVLEV